MCPGTFTVHAADSSEIISAAGGIAVSVGLSGKGNGGAGAFGAAFAINNIGSTADNNSIQAEVNASDVTAAGAILVSAESEADIFALTIGAAEVSPVQAMEMLSESALPDPSLSTTFTSALKLSPPMTAL